VIFRQYDPNKDKDSAHRIWKEIGWIEEGKEEIMDILLEGSHGMVAELDGSAECLVLSSLGTARYLEEDLPFASLTGVSTSRVARKRRLACRLTARVVANDAADGVLVHGLGMFEQGFYNSLGYGTGSYQNWVRFDPARLVVKVSPRTPRRLTKDDWYIMHQARLQRFHSHGSINLTHPGNTRHEVMATRNGFGLGYFDGPGDALSHYFWCEARNVSHGPYNVKWAVYHTPEQFLELMGLLRSLGDQVHLVSMAEPPGIQMQDLVAQPFKQNTVSEHSPFETGIRSIAWWQVRICNLMGCLERTHLRGGSLCFNLEIGDPIRGYLPEDAPWPGVAGEYVVALGPSSGAEPGHDATLPTLRTSVNAFSRLWLGVVPATGLAVTDDLSGPRDLLVALDETLRLPVPQPDWEY